MPPTQAKIHYHRLIYLYNQALPAVVVQALLALIITQVMISALNSVFSVTIWFIVTMIALAIRLWLSKKFIKLTKNRIALTKQNIRLYTNNHVAIIFTIGLTWSWAVFTLGQTSEGPYMYGYQMVAVAFTVGIIGVSTGILSSIPRVFYVFSIPLVLSMLLSLALAGEENFHYAVIGGITLGYLFFAASSRHFSKTFDENIIKNYTIENREFELINRLGMASEYRDNETGNHINRMSYSCYLLALEAGFSQADAELIRIASSLHDIGKLGISDEILLKPSILSPEEREEMQHHTEIGANILADSDSEMINLARVIAENHHEKVDGSGYPKGLKGYQIPVEAKIAAICDVFDALTSSRPYKKAWPNEKALAYIIEQSGSHFDTQLVQKFMKIYPQVIAYSKEYAKINNNPDHNYH